MAPSARTDPVRGATVIATALYRESGGQPPQMPSLSESSPRAMRMRSNPRAEPNLALFYPSTVRTVFA
eukprot:SAG11_NODE_30522_length_300_cov_0.761194_1_plen_67_part_10